ncbi:hypothetical protein [Alloscardovia criceti]|uniref:hypothetical protein n=1 Tax=Alloscardovia criceti TaxID=356828 RepID=UPI00035CB373|nr:hypothetical protein [Alloscardovia criceti]
MTESSSADSHKQEQAENASHEVRTHSTTQHAANPESQAASQSAQEAAKEALEQHKVSHRNRSIVIGVIIGIIVLALVSAFVWPGWALKTASNSSATATGQAEVVAVDPVALPENATQMQKILPDTVGSYARGEVKTTTSWEAASPVEEYEVTYTTGDSQADISIIFGQWTSAQYAKEKYDSLIVALGNQATASGKVNVGGNETGTYEIHADAEDGSKSVVVWQNDTMIFQATGPKNAVNNFFSSFPY